MLTVCSTLAYFTTKIACEILQCIKDYQILGRYLSIVLGKVLLLGVWEDAMNIACVQFIIIVIFN